MYELRVLDTSQNTAQYELAVGVYTVGKSDDCDIVICDTYASRVHAKITVTPESCVIADQESRNGVIINDLRIHTPVAMTEGMPVTIGSHRLLIRRKTDTSAIHYLSATPDDRALPHPETSELTQAKRALHSKVLDYLERHKRGKITEMSADSLRDEAEKACKEVLKSDNVTIPDPISKDQFIKEVVAEAIGLGPIEPLLDDTNITEIMVNGPEHIYIERAGKIIRANARFSGDIALRHAIDRIVAPIGRRIDEGSPMVDARLPDGSRVNAIIPPLSLIGPVLTIRKFSNKKLSMQDLIGRDTLSQSMAAFLEVCVKHCKNIIVSGGTGSGKTTTLNVLSNFIPSDERIVTIEDAAELKLHQEHVVSLEARPANIEGKGEVGIRELVKNALRMRPDRIVVGECRGGEALDMLQAMNTGHDGSLTTGHANSPRDFLSRLEVMVLMSGVELPHQAIREQVASAVDIIVQQERCSDGVRRIVEIVEIDGMEGDTILMQTIFRFRRIGRRPDGTIIGRFEGTGYAPSFYNELREAGIDVDISIFETPLESD